MRLEAPLTKPCTAAEDFLNTLHIEDPATLPSEESTCPICTEDFSQARLDKDVRGPQLWTQLYFEELPFHELPHNGFDHPARLSCNHVVGSSCLIIWTKTNGNSCPLCRAELFPRERNPDPFEDYLDQIEYLDDLSSEQLLTSDWLGRLAHVDINQRSMHELAYRLLENMVASFFKICKLDPLPEVVVDARDVCRRHKRGSKFGAYVEELYDINADHLTRKHHEVRTRLFSEGLPEVWCEFWDFLGSMLERKRLVNSYTLYDRMSRLYRDVPLTDDIRRVIDMSIKICGRYEGRKAALTKMYTKICQQHRYL